MHHELLTWMDGQSVSVEAAAAIATLAAEVRPDIQSDHGSGFIAREFAETLAESGVGHTKIRLHSALFFLRPADYYRGKPEALLAERRRKLQTARELRKQENIKLRQRLIPWVEDQTVSYSGAAIVSL